MSITEIFDAVAPSSYEQALALMVVFAACEEAAAQMLDDVPVLVAALSGEAD